jgi:hypothetical protein
MTAIVPTTNAEVYRASTDAAGLCGEIVLKTAQNIQGRKYVKVEGWQAIAIAHGCAAGARDVERVEGGVRAIGEVRRMADGQIIATAEGFVGEDEPTWFGGKAGSKTLHKRPDYAIRAMAQTRAISRACRSAFAHVVVLIDSKLSTTPAEEVPLGGFSDDAIPGESTVVNPAPSKAALKRSGIFETLRDEIDACQTVDELTAWDARRLDQLKSLPQDWYDALGDRWLSRRDEIEGAAKVADAEREMDGAFSGAIGRAA